jgi:ribosomal protein S8
MEVLANAAKKESLNRDENYKTARLKSKKVRVEFTDTLKEHGYTKRKEYIETTYMMKTRLGINKYTPKNDLDIWELIKIQTSELVATARLGESDAHGFKEVLPIVGKSVDTVSKIDFKG